MESVPKCCSPLLCVYIKVNVDEVPIVNTLMSLSLLDDNDISRMYVCPVHNNIHLCLQSVVSCPFKFVLKGDVCSCYCSYCDLEIEVNYRHLQNIENRVDDNRGISSMYVERNWLDTLLELEEEKEGLDTRAVIESKRRQTKINNVSEIVASMGLVQVILPMLNVELKSKGKKEIQQDVSPIYRSKKEGTQENEKDSCKRNEKVSCECYCSESDITSFVRTAILNVLPLYREEVVLMYKCPIRSPDTILGVAKTLVDYIIDALIYNMDYLRRDTCQTQHSTNICKMRTSARDRAFRKRIRAEVAAVSHVYAKRKKTTLDGDVGSIGKGKERSLVQ